MSLTPTRPGSGSYVRGWTQRQAPASYPRCGHGCVVLRSPDLRQTMGPFAPFVTQDGARSIGRPSIRPIGSWPRPGDGCAPPGPPTVRGTRRGLLVWQLRWGYPTEFEALHPKVTATALIGEEQLQLIGLWFNFVWSVIDEGGQVEDVPSSVELRWRPDDHQAAFTVSS